MKSERKLAAEVGRHLQIEDSLEQTIEIFSR
jgi:hypothetical protein